MPKRYLPFLILFVLITGWACEQNERYKDEPFLQWRKANFRFLGDSADNRRVVDLTVYFTDGDGNVGSEGLSFDTCNLSNYQAFLNNYDLFIYYFEQVNGEFREISPRDSCLPFHNILPDLEPEGQNKTLEGDITTPFDYSSFPLNNGVDSIRFELELKDRAGNRSGRVSSGAIAIQD